MTSFLLERVEEVETMQGNQHEFVPMPLARLNPSMMKTTSPPNLKSTVYLLLCSALGHIFKLKCQIKVHSDLSLWSRQLLISSVSCLLLVPQVGRDQRWCCFTTRSDFLSFLASSYLLIFFSIALSILLFIFIHHV